MFVVRELHHAKHLLVKAKLWNYTFNAAIQDTREDQTVHSSGKRFLAGADLPGDHLPQPLLVCSSGSGIVRLFDLRDSSRHASVEMRCHDQALAGLALRSSGIMATAASTPTVNELHFSDIRTASTTNESMYVTC